MINNIHFLDNHYSALPSNVVHLSGFSTNVGALPRMMRSASVLSSPPMFLAMTFTLPLFSLRSPHKVMWYIWSFLTYSVTTVSLGGNSPSFRNLKIKSSKAIDHCIYVSVCSCCVPVASIYNQCGAF